jgi:hypothetical protein
MPASCLPIRAVYALLKFRLPFTLHAAYRFCREYFLIVDIPIASRRFYSVAAKCHLPRKKKHKHFSNIIMIEPEAPMSSIFHSAKG